ncbi:MAG: dehydrogenase E1 component subunit alpha/beta [Bacteroidetes bacterium]|nr:dehydrogenase E1 component subunit alpha/beta [Bacteroidota bacterium]
MPASATIKVNIKYDRKRYSDNTLVQLYRAILKPRLIEEKMLLQLRKGKVTKWFAGIGQEAITVGATLAIKNEEFILPMHRNLGVFTSRDVPLEKLFTQFQGKEDGFSKGRERSFHFGTKEHNIVGMISHLGPQLGIADGIALADLLENDGKVTLVFTGEGGTSEGDFHEALNVASVWDLPVIFLIENNGYGLSTPTSEQYNCKALIDRAVGYGMEAMQLDGNNILEVYDSIKKIAASMRKKPRPILIECLTFRMHGHEEASGTKYVPPELIEEWSKKDPVANYENFLLAEEVINEEIIEQLKAELDKEIKSALNIAYANPEIIPDTQKELQDIYAENNTGATHAKTNGAKTEKRFVDAISDGLRQSMEKQDKLILMGQDIAEYGGVFKITEGFVESFGKERVRNTPICESAIIGAALGLSIKGYKSVVEMQFADFVTCGFNQITNNLAKIHYRWGQNADVVIRMPTGAGVGAGPFHSQSNEAWFFHTPGLKVVYPSSPFDAKGLLTAAIEDPNPVMYFEHKFLYRSIAEEIPDDYYTVEIGKANKLIEGDQLSIITYGAGVLWAKEAIAENPDISAELIDLRTLMPFDKEAINETVKKTGKVIILHEDTLIGGIGGELSAYISEHLFEYLDAPVMRSAGLDTPVPFAPALENNFLPRERFKEQLVKLANY